MAPVKRRHQRPKCCESNSCGLPREKSGPAMPDRLKQKPLGYGDVSHIRRSNGKKYSRFNECLQILILVIFLLLMYLSFRYMIIKLR